MRPPPSDANQDAPAFAAGLARRAPGPSDGPGGGSPYPSGVLSERQLPWGPPPALDAPTPKGRAALAAVYADVDAALGAADASCRGCGRCCRFTPGGFVLFASSLEVAVLLAEAGPPGRERLGPEGRVFAAWTCPYQDGDRCGARGVRMLGCRTYFCSPEAAARGEAVYADALTAIRAIARTHAYPWWYGPVKVALDAAASAKE